MSPLRTRLVYVQYRSESSCRRFRVLGFVYNLKQMVQLLAYVKQSVDLHHLERPPKVLLKIAPDLNDAELADIAQVILHDLQ